MAPNAELCSTQARLAPRQPHLREDSATKQAIGIPEGLQHLEMIIPLAHDELDRLAGGFYRRVEVARLPLKFRRLVSPMGEYEGRVQLVDVTLRAERFLHLVGKPDVFRALREPHRPEVIHAAAQGRALQDIQRQVLLAPVMGDDASREMRSGRMRREVKPGGIAAKTAGIAKNPGDCASHLLDHRKQAAASLIYVGEIEDHIVSPGIDERL